VEPEKVAVVGGKARVFIHALGKLKPWSLWTKRRRVVEEVRRIAPDVIRAFTPAIHGYFAAYAARALRVPFVLSIHGDFDRDARYFFWKTRQWRNWLQSAFMRLFTERFAIASADDVICAYSFPVRYAREYGAKRVSVIYNKVYAERFERAKPALKLDKPGVICVGRMIPEKNQECLLRAFALDGGALARDARLILIGNGPEQPRLVNLAAELGLGESALFFKAVPNAQIAGYYKSARVFALPIKYGGVAIPVIEAMAAGLPVVVARPELDPNPEFASEVGLVVENTPRAFAEAIKKLLGDKTLYEKLRKRGLEKFASIEGKKMEAKEAAIYEKLAEKKKKK
jgi:glycosyltransferase involved in cell wall biosynthesis